jgi:type I restriction enzyme S subunit
VSEAVRTLNAEPLRRFKPYPAYKDSGVEWLGEIPAHWEVKRLKTFAFVQLSNVDKKSVEGEEPVKLCNYTDVYYNERITFNLEFMAATATREQVRRFSLRAGDVLITKDSESWSDIAVPAVVAEDLPGVLCGYHLAQVRPCSGSVGAFLSRAFSAIGPRDQFQVSANGITRFGLGADAIRTGLFAMPPEPEQRTIAAFLDRETARIDALVAKKERLIELLQKQRTALITRAVTKGLDPTVPMKDSGVDWLGEIPSHWEVKALSRILLRITYGFTNPMPAADVGPYMLTALDIGDGQILYENARRTTDEAFDRLLTDKSRPRSGDILLTKDGTLGRVAVADARRSCINQSVALLRLDLTADVGFMQGVLRSAPYQERMIFEAGGTAIKHIYISRLSRMPVALPGSEEQRTIAAFLDRETARLAALIAKVRDAIERLKELRTALITATVTGKIDVREEAAA